MTKTLAMELGPSNIRVNAIQPRIVAGNRIRDVIREKAKALKVSEQEFAAQLLSRVSLRKMVTPGDVADTAVFPASPAGAVISGQALPVCGNVETLV